MMGSEATVLGSQPGYILRRAGSRDIAVNASMSVGRGQDCDIRIDDKRISRYHARICHRGNGLLVEDLVSTNGTYVNGKRIGQAVFVGHGDTLRFHNTTYRVLDDAPVVAARVHVTRAGETEINSRPAAVVSQVAAVVGAAESRRKSRSKRSAIERQCRRQQRFDRQCEQHSVPLAVGAWIEFSDAQGRTFRCCISLVCDNFADSGADRQYVLVPGSGLGSIEMSARELGRELLQGRARVLARAPLFERLAVCLAALLRQRKPGRQPAYN